MTELETDGAALAEAPAQPEAPRAYAGQAAKYKAAVLSERLVDLVLWHVGECGEFRPEWLDPRAKRFVTQRDGGVSNKEVILAFEADTGAKCDTVAGAVAYLLQNRRPRRGPAVDDELAAY